MKVAKVSITATYDNGETFTVAFDNVNDFTMSQRRPFASDEKQLVTFNRTDVSVAFTNGDQGFKIIPRTDSGLKETGSNPSLSSSDVEDSSKLPR